MAIKSLSGELSETYFIDPGDTVIVPVGEQLVWTGADDDLAMMRTNLGAKTKGDIAVVIAGTLSTGQHGVFVSQPEVTRSLTLTVAETGVVTGGFCFAIGGDNANVFQNFGQIHAGKAAIISSAGNGHILNAGTISGEAAFRFDFATQQQATNQGAILTDYGVLSFDSAGILVENHGEMTCGVMGVAISQDSDFVVENTGSITAQTAISVSFNSTMILQNSGTISASQAAISIDNGSSVTVRNTGDISGSDLIRANFSATASFEVFNAGTMSGDIRAIESAGYGAPADTPDRIVNSGLIDGKIRLGDGDDLYKGRGSGQTMGSVDGGLGADRLIGAKLSDRFDGGADNDMLRGRGGEDQLSGGAGEDTIRGGPGADTLTGGTGTDTFVFGLLAGADIVTDFEQGQDTLHLRHQGIGFDGLTITDDGSDLTVTHDGGTVTLAGLSGEVLSVNDFLFT